MCIDEYIVENIDTAGKELWLNYPNETDFIPKVCPINDNNDYLYCLLNLRKPDSIKSLTQNGLKGTDFQRLFISNFEKEYQSIIKNYVKAEYHYNSKDVLTALQSASFLDSNYYIVISFDYSSICGKNIGFDWKDKYMFLNKLMVLPYEMHTVESFAANSLFILKNFEMPYLKKTKEKSRITSFVQKLFPYNPKLIDFDIEVTPCLEIAYTSDAKAIQITIDDTHININEPIQQIENIFVKH